MHEKKIIHREIKPENCVIDQNSNLIYLIDMGLATPIYKNDQHIFLKDR